MARNRNYATVGAFGGDEGKGKLVSLWAPDAGFIVRLEGGANAGHTVQVGDKKFIGHILPSGALSGKVCVIGRGVRVDLGVLFEELDAFRFKPELLIDEGAHLVFEWHKAIEWWVERVKARAGNEADTTMRGMCGSAASIVLRISVQVGMIYRPDVLSQQLRCFFQMFKTHFFPPPP